MVGGSAKEVKGHKSDFGKSTSESSCRQSGGRATIEMLAALNREETRWGGESRRETGNTIAVVSVKRGSKDKRKTRENERQESKVLRFCLIRGI